MKTNRTVGRPRSRPVVLIQDEDSDGQKTLSQTTKPTKLPTEKEIRETRLQECLDRAVELLGPEIMELQPKDVMLLAMRVALEARWIFRAAELASEVAPYVHAKLQSTTVTDGNSDESRSDDDLRAELDEIRARADAAARTRALAPPVQEEPSVVVDPGSVPGGSHTSSAPRPTLQ